VGAYRRHVELTDEELERLEAVMLLFVKTSAGFGINNIAAAVSTSVLL
jgi:hypothetical protein